MAEGPLPDVVPALDLPFQPGPEFKCAVYTRMASSDAEQPNRPDDLGSRIPPPPVVQVWTNSPTEAEFRRDSVSSELGFVDSGIESQQLSPCLGLEDHAGEFPTSQCGTTLAIPKRMALRRKPHSKESSLEVPSEAGDKEDHLRASPVKLVKAAAELLRRDSSTDSLEKQPQQHLGPGLPGFLPRTRTHRNFISVDYGIQGWRLQEEGFQKMMYHDRVLLSNRSSTDRRSTMEEEDEPYAPPILVVESEKDNQDEGDRKNNAGEAEELEKCRTPRNHRSLEEPRTSLTINRLSLDERNCRTAFSTPRVPLSAEESLEGERSSTCSTGKTRLQLSSLDCGVSEEDNRSESYHPSCTQSVSNSSISDLAENGFSRQPSFGSVRSECVDMRSRRESSEFAAARNWNIKSNSRHFFLSVPPRLSFCNWPSTSSQPGSRRHSAQSQCSIGKPSNPTQSPFVSRLSISRPSSPYHRLGSDEDLDVAALLEGGVLPFVPSATNRVGDLSLTQRLAFPELVGAENQKSRNREVFFEPEGNLNFFAKIITFLVLVFVVVLIVGVIIKLFHTPQ